jgi:hypothetical protein
MGKRGPLFGNLRNTFVGAGNEVCNIFRHCEMEEDIFKCANGLVKKWLMVEDAERRKFC